MNHFRKESVAPLICGVGVGAANAVYSFLKEDVLKEHSPPALI